MKKTRRAMKTYYDLSKAKRGPVIPPTGKTRVTIWLDDAILDHFREIGGRVGKGCQTLINDALRDAIGEGALTPKVVREGLKRETDAGRAPRRIQIGKTGHLTKHPPHVGGVIRREVMEPLGLMVTQAALGAWESGGRPFPAC